MRISKLILAFFCFLAANLEAFPKIRPCERIMLSGVTTEPLEKPALPDLLPPRPSQEPDRAPTPHRKSAPRPMPERPLRPTEDPKDIIARELYLNDARSQEVLKKFPPDLLQRLEHAKNLEIEGLRNELNRAGINGILALQKETMKVLSEIKSIEAGKQEQIIAVIENMVLDNYGEQVKASLSLKISEAIPNRTDSKEGDKLSTSNQLTSLSFKRELYNSLSQAAGWTGMVQFYKTYEAELNAIHPGLAAKYERLHKVMRLGQHEMLSQIPNMEFLQQPGLRDDVSLGREVVSATPEEFTDASGEARVGIKQMQGVAVGVNGWATAHEANKAGFELSTILEAIGRMPLSNAERDYLNDRTNSATAEIRQGIYGVAIDKILRRSLAFLITKDTNTGIANSDYLVCIERIFSQMPPTRFEEFIKIMLSEKFYTDPELQNKARMISGEYGILDGFSN